MPVYTELFVDRVGNQLVTSLSNPGLSTFGNRIIKNDSLFLRVYLLERTANFYNPVPNGGDQFTIIDNSNLALKMALGTQNGATIYTQQFTWTRDGDASYFYAALPLNTVAIGTLIAAATSYPVKPWLEIEVTEVGGYIWTPLQKEINLFPDVITDNPPLVPVPLTSISAEEVAAQYVANISNGQIYRDRTTGQLYDVYMDNGEFHRDPIA